jgi:hypothetical protein
MRQHEDFPYDTIGDGSMNSPILLLVVLFIFVALPIGLLLWLVIKGATKK